MEFGKNGMPEMSKDEILAIAKTLGASDKIVCRLRTLVGSFESAHLFLVAKDPEYKKRCKYGQRMADLVTGIKDRCYALNQEEKAKLVCSVFHQEWVKEKEREYEEMVRKLNPVFTYVELQRILEISKGLEFLDLLEMNRLRSTMTMAHQERLRILYERAESQRQQEELEGLDRIGKDGEAQPAGSDKKGGEGNGAS